MDEVVADTGVFVRWFIEQPGWEHALEIRDAFLQGSVVLATIDFVRVETADVLRKRGLLPGILDAEGFAAAVRAIDDLGVTVHPTDAERLERAARLSSSRMLAVYDAVLVDLALELGPSDHHGRAVVPRRRRAVAHNLAARRGGVTVAGPTVSPWTSQSCWTWRVLGPASCAGG